ncbi:enoyl-CoA-hydratase DpgB [Actinoplanes sp. NPDC051346]|uniref:enoyl-CoA-hydratase DpgB n=1 Tax=Actinoplanes sp. NPDC051346 TaxID=3155048 RepID=UPI00343C51B5
MQLRHVIDGSQPLSRSLVVGLEEFIDRVENQGPSVVPVLELTGRPTAIVASTPSTALVNKWERVLRRLERLNAPTIAEVRGDCAGPAVEALLATDLRIATHDCHLYVSTSGGAVWPGMMLHRLSNQIGAAAVRRHLLFGSALNAGEALSLGLVHEIVDDLPAAVDAACKLAAAVSGDDLAVRRQLMLEATTTPFEEALGRHLAACDRVTRQRRNEEAPDGAALV